LALLAVLCTSLASGFLMDDWFHLERASRPLAGGALDFAFDTGTSGIRLWVHPDPVHIQFVRPVTSLSFWLDRRVWGLHAWGFHLTNILTHALAVLAVFALGRAIGLAHGLARLAALAWGVSAASVPAVQWISGRTEILCGGAAFAATLAFLHWHRTRRPALLALATTLAALAVGAKETGFAVAPLAACLLWARGRLQPGASRGPVALPLALLATPALAMLAYRLLGPGIPLPEGAYTDHIRTAGDAAWFALKPMWALIATLFGAPVSHLGPLEALRAHPAAALAALAAGGVALAVVVRAAGSGVAWPLLAAFVVTLAPSLPVLMTTLYFYQPAVALALLLAAAASRRPGLRRWLGYWIAVGVVAHLGIAYLTATGSQLQDASLARIESALRARPIQRLVVVDAPFWMYGVPVALRVRGNPVAPEVWFVNFAPDLRPAKSSRLWWPAPRELEVRLGRPEGLLSSRIEEFLVFGGSASASPRDSAIAVSAAEPGPHPRQLRVRFASEATLERSLVLRIVRGLPEVVVAPAGTGQGPVPSR
jgi:hypothetical protein